MTEAQFFEKVGRLQSALDDLNANYDALLNAFGQVVAGNIDAARVLVNLTDRSWLYAADGERPTLPAQINGKPVCVVAPPKVESACKAPCEPFECASQTN